VARGRVLADTSLFIEHLRAKDKTAAQLYLLTNRFDVGTSAVVAAEIFNGARTVGAEQQARSVLRPFVVHPFTLEMAARQCSVLPDLLERGHTLDIRDMMIAMSALELDLPLATLNQSHFRWVPGLSLVAFEPI
jgi:predicted nucleic acid-binding protein